MSRPWMPLYIADYRKDTAHLSAAQHGAYLLLIMHYWSTGGLPDDDQQLARIAAMTAAEWRRARPVVVPFFHDGWKHKRIDAELARTAEVAESYASRARQAAEKRWAKHASMDTPSMPEALLEDCQNMPSSQSQRKEDAASAAPDPERELYARGKQVLGERAGGMIKNLLKAKNGDLALARAAVETASTKQNPREYIGGIVNAKPREGEFVWKSGIPGVL